MNHGSTSHFEKDAELSVWPVWEGLDENMNVSKYQDFCKWENCVQPKGCQNVGGRKKSVFKKYMFLIDRTRSLVSMTWKSKATVEKVDYDHQGLRTKRTDSCCIL